jgi:hypothetical protein
MVEVDLPMKLPGQLQTKITVTVHGTGWLLLRGIKPQSNLEL